MLPKLKLILTTSTINRFGSDLHVNSSSVLNNSWCCQD